MTRKHLEETGRILVVNLRRSKMLNTSAAFKQKLINNERNYLLELEIVLQDSTVLDLTNEDIIFGGFSLEDVISPDNYFAALGSVAMNQFSCTINNRNGDYDSYDFNGAIVSVYVGLDISGTVESLSKGKFIVDKALFLNYTVELTCLDFMVKLDKAYSTALSYPTTLSLIVQEICTNCGITLSSASFPRYDFGINYKPDFSNQTYRDVLSWVTTISGCFAKMNNLGQLELKWFDVASNYTIDSLFSQTIGIDDVIITGVRATVRYNGNGNSIDQVSVLEGIEGYVLEIPETNLFINSGNVSNILSYLGNQLIGVTFSIANISHLNDPALEAGDIIGVVDLKDNQHTIYVTRTVFPFYGKQITVCGAETPGRNLLSKFRDSIKIYKETQKLIEEGPESVVTVYVDSVNWSVSPPQATLKAVLRVDGYITVPSAYVWTKNIDPTPISGATTDTLIVTDLDSVYNCTVEW